MSADDDTDMKDLRSARILRAVRNLLPYRDEPDAARIIELLLNEIAPDRRQRIYRAILESGIAAA